MKKIVFLIVAVAIGFAACEKDDRDFAVERSMTPSPNVMYMGDEQDVPVSTKGQGDALPGDLEKNDSSRKDSEGTNPPNPIPELS